jgi:predicted homoserine dehydrogenase-like protein
LHRWAQAKHDIPKDAALTYDDGELPADWIVDQLRAEQYEHFAGSQSQPIDRR